MREYLNKIKSFCASSHRVSDEDHLPYIVSRLGAENNLVMVSISTRFDHISVSEISSLLLTFEARLDSVVNSSFSTDGSGPSVNLTIRGNQSGFTGSNSSSGGRNNNNRGGRSSYNGGSQRGKGGGRSNGPQMSDLL